MKIELTRLIEALKETPETFICAASFESRCLSIANQLDPVKVKRVVILENADFSAHVAENVAILKNKFGEKAITVQLRTDDPFFVADNFKKHVMPLLKNCSNLCLVDVTTFTHEQVLIFIRMLAELNPIGNTKLAYTGAAEYSVDTDPEEKWLSKGLTNVRAVLGYPGIMLPSRKLHLVILTGFEYDRAEKLIEWYEPALLSLGLGRKDSSLSPAHYKANTEFHLEVSLFAETLLRLKAFVQTFEFSCINPRLAMEDIIAQTGKFPEFNVAVCPMNTKPSTIGAALAGLKDENIQLVYTQPVEYNTRGYSTPGDKCTIFDFSECFSALEASLAV